LSFEFYKESYAGAIKAISIGKGDKAITVGGETCYPLYQFEGEMPHKPKLPWRSGTWSPKSGRQRPGTLQGCGSDPAAWAKKCVDEYGAEIIVLQLKSTDPNGKTPARRMPPPRSKSAGRHRRAPGRLGRANHEKDEAVFKQIAEDCQDVQLTLGPVEDKNHKGIGAAPWVTATPSSVRLPSTSTWPSRSTSCWKTWACPWIG
jgi:acetyl-CoA decarbonylase/synthase complex subunit delta